jgi:hypothetical protein
VKLPNGDRADLGTKLEDYVLNPLHREGKHKARVFESALGITLANADILRQKLLVVAANSKNATAKGDNGFGTIYELRSQIITEKGMATVLSAWIVLHGENFPRLTTCFII